jgi:predicted secreted protein
MERQEPIHLRVGDAHDIELPGLGTSGYVWRVDPQPGPSVAVDKKARTEKESGRAIGASASEVFRISARAPGEAQVRFVQSRPWEQGKEPLNERVVDVVVEPATDT